LRGLWGEDVIEFKLLGPSVLGADGQETIKREADDAVMIPLQRADPEESEAKT